MAALSLLSITSARLTPTFCSREWRCPPLDIDSTNFGLDNTTLCLDGAGDGIIRNGIASGGADGTVIKNGVGTWTLTSDDNNWGTGGLAVNEGILQISYVGGTGNDVVLSRVPGPSTLAMLAGLGMLGLLGYIRRRRRQT